MKLSYPVKIGIIAGVAVAVYTCCFYLYISSAWKNIPVESISLSSYFVGIIFSFIPILIGMYYAVQNLKNRTDSTDIRVFIQPAFVVFLVANIFYWVTYYCLFHWNGNLLEVQKQIQTATAFALSKPEDKAMILRQMEMTIFAPTLKTLLFSYAKGAIGGFILSFIMALLFKNR